MSPSMPPVDLKARIVYVFAIIEADGDSNEPCVAWRSAEEARAAAVSFLADCLATGDADEVLGWEEHVAAQDGRYSTFTAPTKYGREVRVWPIEIPDGDEANV